MGFLITLVVLVASTVFASSSPPCTVPPLLQGNMVMIEYVAGNVAKPTVIKSSFAYDALGQRISTHVEQDDGKSFQVLQYYNKKKEYRILSNGSCLVKPLQQSFPFMLIPNTYNHDVHLPSGLDVYTGSTNKDRFVISVNGKCLPMSWLEYRPISGNKALVRQRHFYDVTGRVDFRKFKLPLLCSSPRFILPW